MKIIFYSDKNLHQRFHRHTGMSPGRFFFFFFLACKSDMVKSGTNVGFNVNPRWLNLCYMYSGWLLHSERNNLRVYEL